MDYISEIWRPLRGAAAALGQMPSPGILPRCAGPFFPRCVELPGSSSVAAIAPRTRNLGRRHRGAAGLQQPAGTGGVWRLAYVIHRRPTSTAQRGPGGPTSNAHRTPRGALLPPFLPRPRLPLPFWPSAWQRRVFQWAVPAVPQALLLLLWPALPPLQEGLSAC